MLWSRCGTCLSRRFCVSKWVSPPSVKWNRTESPHRRIDSFGAYETVGKKTVSSARIFCFVSFFISRKRRDKKHNMAKYEAGLRQELTFCSWKPESWMFLLTLRFSISFCMQCSYCWRLQLLMNSFCSCQLLGTEDHRYQLKWRRSEFECTIVVCCSGQQSVTAHSPAKPKSRSFPVFPTGRLRHQLSDRSTKNTLVINDR